MLEHGFMELKDGKYLVINPQPIYNVDETGVAPTYKPPKIIAGTGAIYATTSCRGSNTTVIGCGNACGQYVPPYFIFKGQKSNNNNNNNNIKQHKTTWMIEQPQKQRSNNSRNNDIKQHG